MPLFDRNTNRRHFLRFLAGSPLLAYEGFAGFAAQGPAPGAKFPDTILWGPFKPEDLMDQLAGHMVEALVGNEQYHEWSKGLFMRITDLIEHQSRRLDLQELTLQEMRVLHEEAVARLDRILEKLTDRKN